MYNFTIWESNPPFPENELSEGTIRYNIGNYYIDYFGLETIDENWLNEKLLSFKLENCKIEAKRIIKNTDWSVLPDVNISNKSEFETYRKYIRNLILNPVENPVFPIEPDPIWISDSNENI
jgi:hypothetical protein